MSINRDRSPGSGRGSAASLWKGDRVTCGQPSPRPGDADLYGTWSPSSTPSPASPSSGCHWS